MNEYSTHPIRQYEITLKRSRRGGSIEKGASISVRNMLVRSANMGGLEIHTEVGDGTNIIRATGTLSAGFIVKVLDRTNFKYSVNELELNEPSYA